VPSFWTLLRLALEPRWSDWRDLVRDAPYRAPKRLTNVTAPGPFVPYHRLYGDVILFAHDHAFDHVVPLGHAPEYTLYRIKGAATFREWVETIATQWSRHVRG
jgi:hypothetical protein